MQVSSTPAYLPPEMPSLFFAEQSPCQPQSHFSIFAHTTTPLHNHSQFTIHYIRLPLYSRNHAWTHTLDIRRSLPYWPIIQEMIHPSSLTLPLSLSCLSPSPIILSLWLDFLHTTPHRATAIGSVPTTLTSILQLSSLICKA